MGCSVAAEDYSEDGMGASTHAVVRVRHIEAQDGSTRGDALAGFLRVPAETDPVALFALAGLEQSIPAPGECKREGALSEELDLSDISQAEFLEAESMALLTPEGEHQLAPFAFPTVADLLRGVLYTSRDQDASEIPTGVVYSLAGVGVGSEREGRGVNLATEHLSPSAPVDVQVNGTPIGQVKQLSPSRVLDLSWRQSDGQDDLMLVTLRTADIAWSCTFVDDEGFGSLPLLSEDGVELAPAGTPAQLEVHRLRSTQEPGQNGISRIWVSFDFALGAQVHFGESDD